MHSGKCGCGAECDHAGIILNPAGKRECCGKPEPEEWEGFLAVMEKAATEPGYRKLLLTFDEGTATDWIWYQPAQRSQMLAETRDALFKVISNEELRKKLKIPVVLSEEQLDRGLYRMGDAGERVLRLPSTNTIISIKTRGPSFMLMLLNSHVCGM